MRRTTFDISSRTASTAKSMRVGMISNRRIEDIRVGLNYFGGDKVGGVLGDDVK
jgi:hypothetical protein